MKEDRIIKALESCINNPELDLRTFEQSDEFNILNNGILLSQHIGSVYSGLPIIIDGDLESIIISKKNEIALIILYALVNGEKRYARVIYNSDSHVGFIRKELSPMTHIRLIARYSRNFGEYDGEGIILYNEPLMYGHYICPNCGYDFGIEKNCEGQYCEFCENENANKLKCVTNYYGINT